MKSDDKSEANKSKTPDAEKEESFLKKASSIIINALKRQ